MLRYLVARFLIAALTPALFATKNPAGSGFPADSAHGATPVKQGTLEPNGKQFFSDMAAGPQAVVLSYSTYLPNDLNDNFVVPTRTAVLSVDSSGSACVTNGTTVWVFDPTGNPNVLVVDTISSAPQIVGRAIFRDEQGNCFVAGPADSTPQGGTVFGHSAIGVAKFSPTGMLVYAAYFGGDPVNGTTDLRGITGDPSGSVYITGETTSADFPVQNAIQNLLQGGLSAFLVKLDPSGTSLTYSTFFGSFSTGAAIATDSSGEAFISGNGTVRTTAGAFETSPTLGTGYIAKFDATGKVIYTTYLATAGTGITGANGLAVDASGSAYVMGGSCTPDFPTTPNAFQTSLAGPPGNCNGTVSKLSADGSALVYSTYLGGSSFSGLSAIAVDSGGNAYVLGTAKGANFPSVNPIQSEDLGGTTLTLSALNSTGTALLYSTLFGGLDPAALGNVAVDTAGNVYVSGFTGLHAFPILAANNGSLQFVSCGLMIPCPTPGFVAKISPINGTRMASPAAADFGVLAISAQPRSIPILIQNMGTTAIHITNVVSTGDYSVSSNSCSGSVLSALHCEVDVAFSPTGGGTRSGTLSITSDAPDSPRSIQLTGIGGVPQVSLSPTSLTLTSPGIGITGPPQTVTLINVGADVLNISALAIVGSSAADFSETHSCSGQIPPNARCQINVSYKAGTSNTETAAVQITDDAAGSPHVVNLTGVISTTGGVPQVSLSPASLALTSPGAGATGPSQIVTLSNTGSGVLIINALSIAGPSAADFSETHNCSSQLNPNASCQITINYKAGTPNTEIATVQLTDNAAGSPHIVNLTGVISTLGLAVAPGMPATLTISAGQTAAYNLVIGGPGFGGSVFLNCSGAPAAASCSVPSSANLNSTPTSFQAVVTTTPRSSAAAFPALPGSRQHPTAGWVAVLGFSSLGVLLTRAGRRRKLVMVVGAWLCTMLIASCGGGGTGGGEPHTTGTPAGTYTLTVTANSSAGTTQSLNLTLNVN